MSKKSLSTLKIWTCENIFLTIFLICSDVDPNFIRMSLERIGGFLEVPLNTIYLCPYVASLDEVSTSIKLKEVFDFFHFKKYT